MNNLINLKKYGFSEAFSNEIPKDNPLEPAAVVPVSFRRHGY